MLFLAHQWLLGLLIGVG
uniref:Uncharacterized protein n=1 Tax=Arundo donax TaxID=35708 RepID=A0A0A9SRE9_ARUDO